MAIRCHGAPCRLLGRVGAAGWAVAAVAVASACAATDDGPLVSQEADEVTATPVTESLESSAFEWPAVSVGPPVSEGTVEIADTRYQFTVTCHEHGAGEVVVVGLGEDPDSGEAVELYLQAFLSDPYIGLRLADGTFVEPSLDSPLDLYVQEDVIRASAIRFVRDMDFETGTGTEIGFGELEIHCYEYSREAYG